MALPSEDASSHWMRAGDAVRSAITLHHVMFLLITSPVTHCIYVDEEKTRGLGWVRAVSRYLYIMSLLGTLASQLKPRTTWATNVDHTTREEAFYNRDARDGCRLLFMLLFFNDSGQGWYSRLLESVLRKT
jgi:hypothetical protein